VGVRILILEDDPSIALDLQALLEEEGHEVASIVCSLAEAHRSLDGSFDCALLDIDVVGGKSFGIAETLRSRHIPFAFVSASKPADVPQPLRDAAFIPKPFDERTLLRSVETLGSGLVPCA
jgi:DNA-binding response OmpR family regulator